MSTTEETVFETGLDNLELLRRARAVSQKVRYRDLYWFVVDIDDRGVWFELQHTRRDVVTDEWGTGHGGKRYLTPEMTKSDIVRAMFAACLSYEEHEVRETFTYNGGAIFGPHLDVDAMVEIADRVDY